MLRGDKFRTEVFLSSDIDCNPRETVLGQCTVLTVQEYRNHRLSSASEAYFCRMEFDSLNSKLSSLEEVPWKPCRPERSSIHKHNAAVHPSMRAAKVQKSLKKRLDRLRCGNCASCLSKPKFGQRRACLHSRGKGTEQLNCSSAELFFYQLSDLPTEELCAEDEAHEPFHVLEDEAEFGGVWRCSLHAALLRQAPSSKARLVRRRAMDRQVPASSVLCAKSVVSRI